MAPATVASGVPLPTAIREHGTPYLQELQDAGPVDGGGPAVHLPFIRPHAAGNSDDRLTLAEAAAKARRSSATVKRWTETGQLRCSRRGKTILITRSDLDEFLRADEVPGSDAEIERRAKELVHGRR